MELRLAGSMSLAFTLFAFMLVALGVFAPEIGLVVFLFAGRFELAPPITGFLDISFLTLVGVSIGAIITCIKKRGTAWDSYASVTLGLVAVFVAVVSMNILPEASRIYAWDKGIRLMVQTIPLVVLPMLTLRSRKSFVLFCNTVVIFAGGLALISSLYTFSRTGLHGLNRISPPGGGPITLARITGLAAVICVCLIVASPRRRPFVELMATGFIGFTFLTGSRGPALAIVLVLLALSALVISARPLRQQFARYSWFLTGMALVTVAIVGAGLQMGIPAISRFALLASGNRGGSVNVRSDLLNQAWHQSISNAFLPSGTGSWPVLIGEPDAVAYPHNIFAELLVEQGLLGVTLFLAVILLGALKALRNVVRSNNPTQLWRSLLSLTGLAFSLLVAQVSGDMVDNRLIWFFLGLCLVWPDLDGLEDRHAGRASNESP